MICTALFGYVSLLAGQGSQDGQKTDPFALQCDDAKFALAEIAGVDVPVKGSNPIKASYKAIQLTRERFAFDELLDSSSKIDVSPPYTLSGSANEKFLAVRMSIKTSIDVKWKDVTKIYVRKSDEPKDSFQLVFECKKESVASIERTLIEMEGSNPSKSERESQVSEFDFKVKSKLQMNRFIDRFAPLLKVVLPGLPIETKAME